MMRKGSKTMNRKKGLAAKLSALILAAAVLAAPAVAEDVNGVEGDVGCINANIIGGALITDVCWDCVFPIKVAGIPISGSKFRDRVPDNAATRPFCMCFDNQGVPKPGVQTSFWQPNRLVEFQRVPGCSSVLNGIRFPFNRLNQGTDGHHEERRDNSSTFRHYHYYAFPVMLMLDIFVPTHCNPGAFHDLDVMYLSEVDPTWNNDEIAFFTHPENALLANALAAPACIPDAVTSTAGRPLETLWWCAGSWGMLYPLAGHVVGFDGTLRTTSKLAARTLAQLHRRGIEWGTVGNERMCGGEIMPTLPKYQYRFTLFYPTPETDDSHALGAMVETWGIGRTIPAVGEDPVYIVWRWLDCCNT